MVAKVISRRTLCVALASLIATTAALAGEVQVSWNASQNATGYKLYRGTESGQYLTPTDVGNTTSAPSGDLTDCMTWFFAATAYNVAGESGFSEEVQTWPRAVPAASSPSSVDQGMVMDVTITGMNFRSGDVFAFSNPGVQVNAVTVNSCSQATLTVAVASDAATGPADLLVTHPSGVTGTGLGLFTVALFVDEDPPVITGVGTTQVDGTSAVITWTTDEPASSQVFYRKQGHTLYTTATASGDVTDHAVELTGLEPETTYEFHVSSTDAADNTATTSPDDTFTTDTSPYAYLRFEAESGILVAPVRVTTGGEAFGGAWIDTPAGSSDGTPSNPRGTATYGVNVPENGTWYLWVRMYALSQSTNSWFESIDGAARTAITLSQHNAWTWVEGSAYALDEGLHDVELGGREPEARIDRVLLTNDPDFAPSEQPDVDITPPGAVEDLTVAQDQSTLELTWTNPAASDLARVVICYRTDLQYPTSPVDGSPLIDRPASPDSIDSFVHTGVEPQTAYYYSVFALDASGNVSAAVHAAGNVTSAPPPPGNVVVH